MVNQQQFEKIQSLVNPIIAISNWLLPKIFKCLLIGLVSVGWLIFYALQFWSWHYAWLIPIFIVSVPLLVLTIWSLLLWDLTDLPEALETLKNGVLGVKERVHDNPKETLKVVVRVGQARKLPSLLKELWSMIEGVDVLRTVIGHAIFLSNPLSWLFLVLSIVVTFSYLAMASVSLIFWLL